MADTDLRGDTVIDTLVNLSSEDMRGETAVATIANIAPGADDPGDLISAIMFWAGASDDLRGETVVETIENIVRDSGSDEEVPRDVIGAILMLQDAIGADGSNLFVMSTARDGYINDSGGYTGSVNDRHPMTTPLIPVKPGQSYVFQAWALENTAASGNNGNLWMVYAFYDSEGKAVGGRTQKYGGTTLSSGYAYNTYEITIPDGIAYLRVCSRRVLGGYAKLERGEEPTGWSLSPHDTSVALTEAPICTADNAVLMPPLSATVYGRSSQDGTPTPSVPVAIESVTSCVLHTSPSSLLVWNQVMPDYDSTWTLGSVTVSQDQSTGVMTVACISGSNVVKRAYKSSTAGIDGHKYYIAATVDTTHISVTGNTSVGFNNNITSTGVLYIARNTVGRVSRIVTASADSTNVTYRLPSNTPSGDYATFMDAIIVDLTVAFGAGHEPTAAEFEAAYPEHSYPYDAGTYMDATGWPVTVDLDGHELRSLPNGVRDELALGIDGHVRLVQRVGIADLGDLSYTYNSDYGYFITTPTGIASGTSGDVAMMCTTYSVWACNTVANIRSSMPDKSIAQRGSYATCYIKDSGAGTDPSAFALSMSGQSLIYALAEPLTIDLGPIPLPSLPSPTFTAFVGADERTTLAVTYVTNNS